MAAIEATPVVAAQEDVPPRTRRTRLLAYLGLGLLFLGLAAAVPVRAAYFSNQNQYLLPVVGPTIEHLQADWMLTTVDPYPFFTAVSSVAYAMLGSTAFVLAAILAAACAWGAMYLLTRDLLGGAGRTAAALSLAVVAVVQVLPLVPNVFGGLAGQYILEQPMFFQPAAAGSLVLLGAALALRARINPAQARVRTRWLALAATLLGCALHPTYLVVSALLLLSAMLVDLLAGPRTLRLVVRYAALVIALTVVSILANPAILDLAGGDSGVTSRFAFERIPQHTLMSHWGVWTLRYVAVIVIAALLWRRASPWFSRWLFVSLGLALGLAGVVEITRNTTLALAFPARASVILVPLSMAAIAAFGIRWLLASDRVRLPQRSYLAAGIAVVVAVLGVLGIRQTIAVQTDPPQDEVTELVGGIDPAGVGFVPTGAADNVRLNAGAAIFVDHKSPPYASQDLTEWFRRLDAAQAAQEDSRLLCDLVAEEDLGWVVVRADAARPGCFAGWQDLGVSQHYRLLSARP